MKTFKYFMVYFLAGFVTCTPLQSLHAQALQGKALADSLIKELPNTKKDTNQVKLLIKIVRALVSTSPPAAMKYADSAMHLARQLKWSKGIGIAHINKARVYSATSSYATGIESAGKAYDIFVSINWKPGIADALAR